MTKIQDNIIYGGKRQFYREFYPVIPSLDRIMIVSTVLRYRRLNRRSHFINGRWENLYLDLDCFPGISRVFTAAATAGKKLTGNPLIVPHSSNGFPKNEFWFNVAGPGESTGLHDHKSEAVLSGVYYLQVSDSSGNLHFLVQDGSPGLINNVEIESTNGKMVLFPSWQKHFVSRNQSQGLRVSLAFNLYKFPLQDFREQPGYELKKYFS